MKTIKSVGLLICIICLLPINTNAKKIKGHSNTEMGKYEIEQSTECINLKGKELKTYTLCYENCEKQMLIGIDEQKDCKNFIVVIDDLTIIYACNKGVFGAKKLPKQKSTKLSLNEAIDRHQFYYQKVISKKPKTEKELLALIACYYPQLINEEYIMNNTST